MKLKDQIILITGSTRGIGKEIATTFAKAGATVIISGTNEELAKRTCSELRKAGFPSESFVCDITKPENVEKMVNKTAGIYREL